MPTGEWTFDFVAPMRDAKDDNVDVQVTFNDGARYYGTFFTLKNIERIMETYITSGECLSGAYFWAADMIIVKSLGTDAVRNVIRDLICNGEFETAFDGPHFE